MSSGQIGALTYRDAQSDVGQAKHTTRDDPSSTKKPPEGGLCLVNRWLCLQRLVLELLPAQRCFVHQPTFCDGENCHTASIVITLFGYGIQALVSAR